MRAAHARFILARSIRDQDVDAKISADGGDGNDVLLGGAGADMLSGGAGKDTVMGRGGRDWIDGGKDNDRDVLEGGADADVVVARKGDRVIGDHETGAKGGPDLVVDGDMQDRMEEAVRGR